MECRNPPGNDAPELEMRRESPDLSLLDIPFVLYAAMAWIYIKTVVYHGNGELWLGAYL